MVRIITLAQGSVVTSGTQVRAFPTPIGNVIKVWITCPNANTGSIYIGDNDVATTRGIEVPKNSTYVIEAHGEMISTETLFIDATTSGDDFQVTYAQKIS